MQSRGNLPKISATVGKSTSRPPSCRTQRRAVLHRTQALIDNGNGVSDGTCERLPGEFRTRLEGRFPERSRQRKSRGARRRLRGGYRSIVNALHIGRKLQPTLLDSFGNARPQVTRQGSDFLGELRVMSLYVGRGHRSR